MKTGNHLLTLVIVLLLFASAGCTYYQNPGEAEDPDPQPELSYIGSNSCAACHQETFDSFAKSGHPYILQQVKDGDAPIFPFTNIDFVPPSFSNDWQDVSYTIGGFAWKAQYIDNDGFIYTGTDAQYNLQSDAASAYHPEMAPGTKKFDCGKCHTTGYKSIAEGGTAQGGLAGMDGEFFAAGVQCEACHGMGSFHANSRSAADITIDRSAEACGQCHSRNADHSIAAADGFILNYTQYDEMKASKHQDLSCIDCHNPHVSVKHGETGGIVNACLTCHEGIKNPTHRSADCLTCHMPYATKSAMSTNKYVADVQTHIFKINTDKNGEMFNTEGTVANGTSGVTLDYVCYQCHKDNQGIGGDNSKKSMTQLSARANGYHD